MKRSNRSTLIRKGGHALAYIAVMTGTFGCSVGVPVVTTYACDYEIARLGTSGQLSLTLRDDVIQSVNFSNFYEGLPGKPGFSCYIDASRSKNADQWRYYDEKTVINFTEKGQDAEEDVLEIIRVREQFLLDMSNTRSAYKCGAGAELPKYIALSTTAQKCVVKLDRPRGP